MVAELRSSGKARTTDNKNTDSWLTRNESAALLGVSENTIANWQRQDILHPSIARRRLPSGQTHEVQVYDPQELAKCPVRRVTGRTAGDIAAKAFEMFEQGESRRQVVIATREEPDKIDALYDQWKDMGGSDIVLTIESREHLRTLLGAERINSIPDLIEAIKKLLPASGA